ncbi:MAG: hypothetical protein II738_03670, partial [Clostridia bacterium]|nr:hypothetical protein [Clostridia bacterium]
MKRRRNLTPERLARLERRRETRQRRYASYRVLRPEEERPTHFMTTFRRLFGYVIKFRARFAVVAVACVLATLCNVIGPTGIGNAIDALSAQVNLKINGGQISPRELVPNLVFLLVIYGGMALFAFLQQFNMAGITARVVRRLREEINLKFSHLPLRYFDHHSKGDLISRVTNDIDN